MYVSIKHKILFYDLNLSGIYIYHFPSALQSCDHLHIARPKHSLNNFHFCRALHHNIHSLGKHIKSVPIFGFCE